MNLALEISNVVGIIAFAIAGSIKAVNKQMDLLGALVMGFSSSLAGGIVADLLLGMSPPSNLTYLPYPALAFSSSVAGFVFKKKISKISRPLLYADAIGLGAFAASGSSLAFSIRPEPLLVIMVGTITAVGGGVVRDILANEVPMIMEREFYASAALIGSTAYFLLRVLLGLGDPTASTVTFALTLTLRVSAIHLGWKLPRPKG
jgi:uncharacterized membrane protein YeiH